MNRNLGMRLETERLVLRRPTLADVPALFEFLGEWRCFGTAMLRARTLLAAHAPTRRKSMVRTFVIAAASAAVLMLSPTAFAQQSGGNAEEAKAMLVKAVAAVKADKTKALDMFNKGEGGFLDRDLYPFCFNASDGKTVALANPNAKELLGQDVRTNKDTTGKMFGLDLYAAAQKAEGQITEVSYMFSSPGADAKPVPKISFVTRVGDLGCGVGYYK